VAALLVVGGALAIGLILGVFAGLTSVPAWALTLGVAAGLSTVGIALFGASPRVLREEPLSDLLVNLSLAGFIVVSLGGGALWLIPAVRRVLSGSRVLAAVVGLAGSSALAALGGVLLARFGNAVFVPGQEISFTLGAVLLGGVSVFGWRGGVAGTALAVSLLVILGSWLAASDAEGWQVTMGAGIAIIVGLVVNLILRALDQPGSEDLAA
jgi:hypothetical protein